MNRPSRLIYSESRTELRNSQSEDGDCQFYSNLGVPILWFFAFGGRNIWDPGDHVEERGGRVGERNPYETSLEVALTRLEHVEASISDDKYLWPLLSALPLMRRRLALKRKTGFLRVVAPWVIGLEQIHVDRWSAATAFAENFVNFLSHNRRPEAIRSIRELTPFCPFVPDGVLDDLKTIEAHKAYPKKPLEMRLTLLTMGEPQEAPETVENWVMRDVKPRLEAFRQLPPIATVPGDKPSRIPTRPTDSIFGRLKELFGRG